MLSHIKNLFEKSRKSKNPYKEFGKEISLEEAERHFKMFDGIENAYVHYNAGLLESTYEKGSSDEIFKFLRDFSNRAKPENITGSYKEIEDKHKIKTEISLEERANGDYKPYRILDVTYSSKKFGNLRYSIVGSNDKIWPVYDWQKKNRACLLNSSEKIEKKLGRP